MKTPLTNQPAARSGAFAIGGDLLVHRLGFGAMRLTGEGIWGEPPDHQECVAVLRRAVELGITLIDTADSYGPKVSERFIAEALHPYPNDLVIAPRPGFSQPGPAKGVKTDGPNILPPPSKEVFARPNWNRIN